MGQCLSVLEEASRKYEQSQQPQQQNHAGAAQPANGGSYAAAAGAGAAAAPHHAANVTVSHGAGAPVAGGSGYSMCKVLWFPDPGMPCRNGANCRRPNCTFVHNPTSLSQLLEVINSARQSLIICVFTITCDDIADAVIAAHQRGVSVRVISDDDQAKTQGSDVVRIQQAGVPVKVDHNQTHMHHKFAVVDGRILINGSFNWTRQAVLGNQENVVILDIPSLTAEFTRRFEYLWGQFTSM